MSAATGVLLWDCVSGGLVFVFYRTRVGRALALCAPVFIGACGYIGFRLECGFHI